MYYVEDSHEAIIDLGTFNRVQQELDRRAKKYYRPNNEKTSYFFTGLIRCGLCGKRYRRRIVHANSKYKKAVWICPTFDNCGKTMCPSQQIPETVLTAKTSEILGFNGWDRETLLQYISRIDVPGHNTLVYLFQDGHTETIHWQNPSRRESWSKEAKQKAREFELERVKCEKEEKR